MVRAMCGVQLKNRKRFTDLMFMLGFKETVDQLAMANCVRWYGHVLRREGHWILRFMVKGRRGVQRGHGKSRLRKKI